jgi:hypothetical protein
MDQAVYWINSAILNAALRMIKAMNRLNAKGLIKSSNQGTDGSGFPNVGRNRWQTFAWTFASLRLIWPNALHFLAVRAEQRMLHRA